jgi:phenylpropionate dioxygenase-like ring-hydroxylating dioxygenase large terminal subunit
VTTREQNDILTRTGPGTSMGELFRRYWIPALLPEELPEPDCTPVRLTLLSERLIAFRDSSGRLGLIDEFCAHRGVSLWFGRNEQDGLRCPYHGWKYDVAGQCVEVPSEPAESGYAEKIRLKAYPLVERGGILWTYMGPPELQPGLPEFEFALVGPKHRFVSKRLQECNWLQAFEGGIDPTHVAFLHKLDDDPMFKGAKANNYTRQDVQIKFEARKSDGGLMFGARRETEDGGHYWRLSHWIMPSYTTVGPRGDHPILGHFWIPIDDENCWVWSYNFLPTRELTQQQLDVMKNGQGIHVKLSPGTYRPVRNQDNDYLMDRAAQKAGKTFSGIEGLANQDAAIQESMGPIQDRSRENLVSSDNFIIMTRLRLLEAAKALREKGTPPPGVDPATHRVRSAARFLPRGADFAESFKDAIQVREGVPHVNE